MKFTNILVSTALLASVCAAPLRDASDELRVTQLGGRSRGNTNTSFKRADTPVPSPAQVAALAPELGFQAGLNPTGTGDCDGAVRGADGKAVKIPCSCPPARDRFIQLLQENVAAGHAVRNPTISVVFPTDDSKSSKLDRIQAAIVTLQNIEGPGKGCPAASSTLVAQRGAIEATPDSPAPPPPSNPAPAPPPPASAPPASGSVTPQQIAALAPDLGFQAGVNPTGTGDCDGAVIGKDGKPVKVPCTCPPARDKFISLLQENVAAGHAVKNPGVAVNFPTDDSTAAKLDRIEAAIVTLQNIDGPGKGCPAAATTLVAQRDALSRAA